MLRQIRSHWIASGVVFAILIGCWFLFGSNLGFGDDPDGTKAAAAEMDTADFRAMLEARIDEGDFDCADFDILDRQACLIFQSALGIEADVGSARFKTFLAIETMNVVPTLVSSARYSLIAGRQGERFESPGIDAELCLDLGYGICGNHARTAIDLLERLDVPARAVQFFFSKDGDRHSHVAIEADIDGWRYFDMTWGAFWHRDQADPVGSILSAEEIMSAEMPFMKSNQTQSWYLMARDHYDPFDYFQHAKNAIYGYDDGIVEIVDPSPQIGGSIDLSHLPKYVGDNRDDGPFEGLAYAFSPIAGMSRIELNAKSIGGCRSDDNEICVDGTCTKIDRETKRYVIEARDASTIFLKVPSDTVCYVQFDGIVIGDERLSGEKMRQEKAKAG